MRKEKKKRKSLSIVRSGVKRTRRPHLALKLFIGLDEVISVLVN